MLFKCDKHRTERDKLKDTTLKRGQSWSICKHDLISKLRKALIKFVNIVELEDAQTVIRMIGKKLNELEVANNVVIR